MSRTLPGQSRSLFLTSYRTLSLILFPTPSLSDLMTEGLLRVRMVPCPLAGLMPGRVMTRLTRTWYPMSPM